MLERFRETGPGWQGRINKALRKLAPAHLPSPAEAGFAKAGAEGDGNARANPRARYLILHPYRGARGLRPSRAAPILSQRRVEH